MNRNRLIVFLPLAALLPLAVPTSALAGERDHVIRGGLLYVAGTSESSGSAAVRGEFLDPRFPPLGELHRDSQFVIQAENDFGIAVEYEYKFNDLLGLNANISYTRQVVEVTYSGTATFTPYWGDPPTPVPEQADISPIVGGGFGKMDLVLPTVSASFHVLRRDKVDLYIGPSLGFAAFNATYESGSYTSVFSFINIQRLAGMQEGDAQLGWGAVLGLDLPVGPGGWRFSIAARYLQTGELNPATIQFGLGYRF
jgi:opacity protein-like surface antigen